LNYFVIAMQIIVIYSFNYYFKNPANYRP